MEFFVLKKTEYVCPDKTLTTNPDEAEKYKHYRDAQIKKFDLDEPDKFHIEKLDFDFEFEDERQLQFPNLEGRKWKRQENK